MLSALCDRLGIGSAREPARATHVLPTHREKPHAVVIVDFGGTASHFFALTGAAVSYEAILKEARKQFEVDYAFVVFPQTVLSARTDVVARFEEMGYFVQIVSQLDFDASSGHDRVDDTVLSLARMALSHGNVSDVVLVSEHHSVLHSGRVRLEKSCGGRVHCIQPSIEPERYTASSDEPHLYMPFLVKLKDVHTVVELAQSGSDIPENLRRVAMAVVFAFRVCEERFQHETSYSECIDVLETALRVRDENIHPKSASNIVDVFLKRNVLLARHRERRLLIRYNPEHNIVTKKAAE